MATLDQLVAIGAPLLTAVLGGPPSLAIGAISLANEALGLPRNSSVQDLALEVQSNPGAASKLRDLETSYQQYLISVRLQMDQAEYADRANARAREVAISKATGKWDWYASLLGFFVIISFTLILGKMILSPPRSSDSDENTKGLINILVGTLTAGYSTVLAYYFGSSAGSRNKDNTIASLSAESLASPSISPIPPRPEPPQMLPTLPMPMGAQQLRTNWRDP